MLVTTCLRILGGAIPANTYIYVNGVYLRHPVITLRVSFSAVSTCLVCFDWFHTREVYSPAKKKKKIASPVV